MAPDRPRSRRNSNKRGSVPSTFFLRSAKSNTCQAFPDIQVFSVCFALAMIPELEGVRNRKDTIAGGPGRIGRLAAIA